MDMLLLSVGRASNLRRADYFLVSVREHNGERDSNAECNGERGEERETASDDGHAVIIGRARLELEARGLFLVSFLD